MAVMTPDSTTSVIVDADRPVVGLSGWLSAMINSAPDRTVYLRTGPDSAVTYPVEVMITETPLDWVVVDGERTYDGLSGQPLAWNGTDYQPSGELPASIADSGEAAGTLRIEVTALWAASEDLQLGGPFETICQVLGQQPSGWGETEPISRTWSDRSLTSFARSRAPRSTAVALLAGAGRTATTGLLAVDRVTAGVSIMQRLAVPADRPPDAALLESLAAAVTSQAVRTMSVLWQPGTAGGLRHPVPTPEPIPLGMLIGPETVLSVGTDYAQAVQVPGRFFGEGPLISRWCAFDRANAVASWQTVMQHFAPDPGALPPV